MVNNNEFMHAINTGAITKNVSMKGKIQLSQLTIIRNRNRITLLNKFNSNLI